MMRRLDATTPLFDAALDQLLEFVVARDPQVVTTVSAIIDAVQRRGDAALLEYTNRYDQREIEDATLLEVPVPRLAQALDRIEPAQREALREAAVRIDEFHRRQRQESWQYHDAGGTLLGQRVTPLDGV